MSLLQSKGAQSAHPYTIFALPDLVVPVPMLSGSGEDELVAGQVRILRAYNALIEALRREMPHGRDHPEHYRDAYEAAAREIEVVRQLSNRHEALGLDIRKIFE